MLVKPHAAVVITFDSPLYGHQVVTLAERAVDAIDDDAPLPRYLHVAKQQHNPDEVLVTQIARFPRAQVAISASADDQYITLGHLYDSVVIYDVTWPVSPYHNVDKDYVDGIKLDVARFAEAMQQVYDEAPVTDSYHGKT